MQKIWQQLYTKIGDYRFERKFFITELTKQEIEAMIKLHPFVFSEIFYERFINNIYLDSFNLKNYFDNEAGAGQRCKARIRWYGDFFGFIQNPVLEIKMKNNNVGAKACYPLTSFVVDENFSVNTFKKLFKESEIPKWLEVELSPMEPSLFNRYQRKYFQSQDKNFRFTIDSQIQCFQPSRISNTFLKNWTDYNNIVLELKYKKDKDDLAEKVTNFLPARMTKSSKYVTGIDTLNA